PSQFASARMPCTSSRILRVRLVMVLEPILQLSSTLCRFGQNFGRIATSLTVFNLPMHHHRLVVVILNISGGRCYLGFSQIQRSGNVRTRPSGFEVVEDIPDGDPCACNTVLHNHWYAYQFNSLGAGNSRRLLIVVIQSPNAPALTLHRPIPDRTGRRSLQEHHFTLALGYRLLAIVEYDLVRGSPSDSIVTPNRL